VKTRLAIGFDTDLAQANLPHEFGKAQLRQANAVSNCQLTHGKKRSQDHNAILLLFHHYH